MLWGPNATIRKLNPASEGTSFPIHVLIVSTLRRKEGGCPGSPARVHTGVFSGWCRSPNIQLQASAVWPRRGGGGLVSLYCHQLSGAVVNDLFVSWIDYRLLLTLLT